MTQQSGVNYPTTPGNPQTLPQNPPLNTAPIFLASANNGFYNSVKAVYTRPANPQQTNGNFTIRLQGNCLAICYSGLYLLSTPPVPDFFDYLGMKINNDFSGYGIDAASGTAFSFIDPLEIPINAPRSPLLASGGSSNLIQAVSGPTCLFKLKGINFNTLYFRYCWNSTLAVNSYAGSSFASMLSVFAWYDETEKFPDLFV